MTIRVSTLIATSKLVGRSSPPRLLRSRIAAPLTILCVLCALLTSCVGIAGAYSKLIPLGDFSSEHATGVAVDQSTGDVYVTNSEAFAQALNKFNATGGLLSPSPFGEGHFPSGAAVNPIDGDVYVLGNDVISYVGLGGGHFEPEIETYNPSGGLLSVFSVPRSGNGDLFGEPIGGGLFSEVQIASDSSGNVYVPVVVDNEVLEYDPGTCPVPSEPPEPCTPLKAFKGSGASALSEPTGVAVAPSGNVWVADKGNNRIEEFNPAGTVIGEIKSEETEGVQSIAVDGQGDVFALVINSVDSCTPLGLPCEHLVEYSASGAQIADIGAGSLLFAKGHEIPPSKNYRNTTMVAVDNATGRVYVTDAYNGVVWMFQPPAAPVLGQESAVEVGTSEAKLGAPVDPGGAQTTYRFEYDTREYREGEGPHGVSVPFPEGSAGEGLSSRTVWASAKGLAPGTTYHYRAIVTNALGTVVGPDETFTTETAAQVACPNEAVRGGYSAALPDCRAYELVTPLGKSAGQPENVLEAEQAEAYSSDDGDRFSFESTEVEPGSQSAGFEFLATRGASEWTTQSVLPLQSYTGDRCSWLGESHVVQYSADMTATIVYDNGAYAGPHSGGNDGEPNEKCLGEDREVVSGEPLTAENLLLRDNETGGYQLIDVTPPGVTPTNPKFFAASANLSVVLFEERAKLTPEAPSNTMNTYEWRAGVVRLFKFALPSGAPVAGSFVAFSDDGSEMFFTAGGNLYVSLNGGERTVQVDEARDGGSGPGGGGGFATVTPDGSQAFFTDEASAGLTGDTVAGSGTNLYSYDIDTGQLSDLTPVAHAGVSLVDIGEEGSYVYFTSGSVLSGAHANQIGEVAESGHSNLYVEHDGTITFVIQRGGADQEERFSFNGAFFGFQTTNSLTGYDTEGSPEIYLYSAAANRFKCATCNPSGEPGDGARFAGTLERGRQNPHFVSNDGQVFFDSGAPLLPRVTDGVTNVYEFDYGSGLHLISSGTSSSNSELLDSSPSGEDVFFLTRQALISGEVGEESDRVYDARVDGGFPEAAALPACTTADACRVASELQPAIFGEPSSQTFSGAGNIASPPSPPALKTVVKSKQCKKGFVKKKGKCIKKKQSKKATKAKKSNRATNERRGS